ncbi:MAG: type II CRISPR RNA-guided endonuclease Cas9 [Gammaproteobacteria bacterium AqS3]|nr:type II CRISPR RNA-guided endonuclease Cas9 [Gammaproteobacteria bacterium AqS3]
MASKERRKWILGIDGGTNSLGWAAVGRNERSQPSDIIRAGVQIFADPLVDKGEPSARERSAARRMRRLVGRRQARRDELRTKLRALGLLPDTHDNELSSRGLEFRAKLIDETAEEVAGGRFNPGWVVGYALCSLNVRRGFKSTRKERSAGAGKSKSNDDAGKVLEAIKSTREVRGGLTHGQHLYQRLLDEKTTRSRPGSDGYNETFPNRDDIASEFDQIMEAVKSEFKNITDDDIAAMRSLILDQRQGVAPPRGICSFMPAEQRGYKASPIIERFRMMQEVGNISWIDSMGEVQRMVEYVDVRDELISHLRTKKSMTVGALGKFIDKRVPDFVELNTGDIRDKFVGCLTDIEMIKAIDDRWPQMPLEKQDAMVELLLSLASDESVLDRLQNEFGLSHNEAGAVLDVKLVRGTASVSNQAALLLVGQMERGLDFTQAVNALVSERNDFTDGLPVVRGLKKRLPNYEVHFAGTSHVDAITGRFTNPTLDRFFRILRTVVNRLIREHGRPDEAVVELVREIAQGEVKRKEHSKRQKAAQKENERRAKKLEEEGVAVTRENLRLLRLWEDQNEECIYTGKIIARTELFDGSCDIDHIVPRIKSSTDNRLLNVVLCTAGANRYKRDRTPHEAYGQSLDGYDWGAITERIKWLRKERKISREKVERFGEDARKLYDPENGLPIRLLTETAYIAKLMRAYLSSIIPAEHIHAIAGNVTAKQRKEWGLNNIVGTSEEDGKKARDDHRHHAVDAITIACCTPASLAKCAATDSTPWPTIRCDVKVVVDNIIAVHRVDRHEEGTLHEDTFYSMKHDRPASRNVASWFTAEKTSEKCRARIEKVVDLGLRSSMLRIFDNAGIDDKAVLQEWLAHPKRRIRGIRTFQDSRGQPVEIGRSHPRWVFTGGNWAVEVRGVDGGNWIAKVVDRLTANASNRAGVDGRLVMRLHRNDLVWLGDKIMRIKEISGGQEPLIRLADPNLIDGRPVTVTLSVLKKRGVRLAKPSPLGTFPQE